MLKFLIELGFYFFTLPMFIIYGFMFFVDGNPGWMLYTSLMVWWILIEVNTDKGPVCTFHYDSSGVTAFEIRKP